MSGQTSTVTISWSYSHDRGDGDIRYQLEAGGDEGPLLVLPAERSTYPGATAIIGIFRNVDWYIASLVDVDPAAPRERWAGLVRGTDRDNGDIALAALQRVAQILSPPRKPRRITPSRSRPTELHPPDGAVTEPIDFDGVIRIENDGEGFDDVAHTYPGLTPSMSV